jgi:hypothetical protein
MGLEADKQSLLRAQVGADIEELSNHMREMAKNLEWHHQRILYLEQVCEQCILEQQGRGQ